MYTTRPSRMWRNKRLRDKPSFLRSKFKRARRTGKISKKEHESLLDTLQRKLTKRGYQNRKLRKQPNPIYAWWKHLTKKEIEAENEKRKAGATK